MSELELKRQAPEGENGYFGWIADSVKKEATEESLVTAFQEVERSTRNEATQGRKRNAGVAHTRTWEDVVRATPKPDLDCEEQHAGAHARVSRTRWLYLNFWSLLPPTWSARRLTRIERPPCFAVCQLLGYFCRREFRERELEAAHGDMVADYFDHLAAGKRWGARIVRIMMPVHMVALVGFNWLTRAAGAVFEKLSKAGDD